MEKDAIMFAIVLISIRENQKPSMSSGPNFEGPSRSPRRRYLREAGNIVVAGSIGDSGGGNGADEYEYPSRRRGIRRRGIARGLDSNEGTSERGFDEPDGHRDVRVHHEGTERREVIAVTAGDFTTTRP